MQKPFKFFVAFLFALLCVGVHLLAEEITLTTYYPAPYGNYEELQATKLAVGSATTMPTTDCTINAVSYQVSGTAGWSGTVTYLKDLGGSTGAITVVNGIITNAT